MNLDQLAIKYGSDKSSLGHNYCGFYEKHLPKNPKRILEIGVKEGASLAMWAEFFPDAEIHGLDLFAEHSFHSVIEFVDRACRKGQQMHLWEGNQCDWMRLEELRKYDFDLIIDDGSHNARDQMITFFGLFNGKHYFIEDTHCNSEDFYSQGLPESVRASYLFSSVWENNSAFDLNPEIKFGPHTVSKGKIIYISCS